MSAPFCYVEIPAPDMDKAATFYSTVFGWRVQPSFLSANESRIFGFDEEEHSGGFSSELPVQDGSGGILLYIKVSDILATLQTIESLGGEVVQNKKAVGGEFGFSAKFRDPNGNCLGLWAQD